MENEFQSCTAHWKKMPFGGRTHVNCKPKKQFFFTGNHIPTHAVRITSYFSLGGRPSSLTLCFCKTITNIVLRPLCLAFLPKIGKKVLSFSLNPDLRTHIALPSTWLRRSTLNHSQYRSIYCSRPTSDFLHKSSAVGRLYLFSSLAFVDWLLLQFIFTIWVAHKSVRNLTLILMRIDLVIGCKEASHFRNDGLIIMYFAFSQR